MATASQRRVDPGTIEYKWAAKVVDAVARRTRRPTRWNGEIIAERSGRRTGAVTPEGALILNEDLVLEPIRRAYGGDDLTADDVIRAHQATEVAVHEGFHLTVAEDDPNALGRHPVDSGANHALDEGLAEFWMWVNINEVERDIGMDQAVPGITEVETSDSYPTLTAASMSFLNGVGDVTGLERRVVARQIVGSAVTQRFNTAAVVCLKALARSWTTSPPSGTWPTCSTSISPPCMPFTHRTSSIMPRRRCSAGRSAASRLTDSGSERTSLEAAADDPVAVRNRFVRVRLHAATATGSAESM